MKTEKYAVRGMTCTSCVAHVERSVNKLEGIQTVQVNLLDNSMTVSYDETKINTDAISKSVEDAGYEVHVKTEKTSETTETKKIDYVQLEQVDAVALQRRETGLDLRQPALSASGGNLAGEKHRVARVLPPDQFAHHAIGIAIARRGIDQPGAAVDENSQHLQQCVHL